MPVDQSRQYLRIRDQLAADIAQGVLQVKLPSERELAERFLCTRITLREALQQLETEGLVYRENRRGWFVAPPRIRYNPTRTTGFMEYVSAQGRQPRTETLHAERRAAGAWLAKRMGLEDSAPVYFLQRRRWVDERPVLIELIALDAGWCPGLLDHDLDTSLMSLLRERFGLQPTRCQLAMHPTALNAAQAEPLQLAPGSPALYLERLSYAEGQRVVEFDQEFWRRTPWRSCSTRPIRAPESGDRGAYAVRHGRRTVFRVAHPDQLAVAFAIGALRIFQGAQAMFQYQAAGAQLAGVQFHHHGGRMHHRLQVGVQALQHDRPLGSAFQVDAEGFEPGHPGLFQVLEIKGVVDVPVAVHVAPAHRDMGRV